jgi:DamX protein
MSDLHPETTQAPKDKLLFANERKKRLRLTNQFNRTTMILVLIIAILLLLISFLLFRTPDTADSNGMNRHQAGNQYQTNRIESRYTGQTNQNNSEFTTDPSYSDLSDYEMNGRSLNIDGQEISRTPTESARGQNDYKSQLVIPGEIVDEFDSRQRKEFINNQMNAKSYFNELPLGNNLDTKHYTIQLIGSSSLPSILDFAKKNRVTNYQIYETRRYDKIWFVLIKGNYPTKGDALEALNALPDELKTNGPWVRMGEAILKDKL